MEKRQPCLGLKQPEVVPILPKPSLDLKTRWYWMEGMKKLLAATFVAGKEAEDGI
jgi:hypothetical protein